MDTASEEGQPHGQHESEFLKLKFKRSAAGDLMLIGPTLSTLTGNESHYLGASRLRKPQPASHRCEPASIWAGDVTHRTAGQFQL